MWPETLNRGQELRFLSLLEHLLLKSEIRRQTMEADTTQFQATNGNSPEGLGGGGFRSAMKSISLSADTAIPKKRLSKLPRPGAKSGLWYCRTKNWPPKAATLRGQKPKL